jgi:quercetin dioxygenase-like cupin family protein
MKKRHRITAASGLVALAAVVLSGMALAAHGGLHGLFNSRGTIDRFKIHEPNMKLKIKAVEPIDVAIVGAQLDPGAETGWHTHPADSLVTVQPGGPALTMIVVRNGECVERTFQPGQALVHPARRHNFVNKSTETVLNFGVAYFVPVGAPLLTPALAPDACA